MLQKLTAPGGPTRAALIGAATGLRSTWGLAALAWTSESSPTVRGAGTSMLARPRVRAVTLAAAAGEFVADKSPRIPSRLSAGGLVPRLLLGALSAAALCERGRRGPVSPAAGAAAGATAALALSFAGVRWRAASRSRVGTDAVGAALEDIAGAALAWAACANTGAGRHRDTETVRAERQNDGETA